MLGQKLLSCFLIFAVLASVGVFAQALPDGSVAYWRPSFFGTDYLSLQELENIATTASSIPVASAEFVPVEPGICYDEQQFMQEDHPFFEYLEKVQQRNNPSVKQAARNALLNAPYTMFLQVGYAIENGQTNPLAEGSWENCPLGCIVRFIYRGEIYTSVCIKQICEEGSAPNTDAYCDPATGDVYYYHTMFWCEDIPHPWIRCGEGGRCTETPDGLRCRGYPVDPSSSSSSQGAEYVLVAPKNPSEPIMVAAIQNGQVIAKEPISNLSAEAYVARYGPIDAGQAESFAVSTGLAELVESMLGNPFAANRLAQFR